MTELPRNATVALTYRCNSRCRICRIWKHDNRMSDEINIGEFAKFVDKSPVPQINITGGELFLIPNLMDYIKILIKKGQPIYLPTNSIAVDKILAIMAELSHLDDKFSFVLQVSIDGIGITDDYVRGVSGHFVNAVNLIKWTQALSQRDNRFKPTVSHTICKSNYEELPEFIDYFINMGIPPIDLSFRIVQLSPVYYDNTDSSEFITEPKGVTKAIKTVMDKHSWYRKSEFCRSLLKHIERPHKLVHPCAAGEDVCFIDPYWNVYPCLSWHKSIGNLKRADFCMNTILESTEWRKARKDIMLGKCAVCWSECNALPSLEAL